MVKELNLAKLENASALTDRYNDLNIRVERLNQLMALVVIVLLVGFALLLATLVIDLTNSIKDSSSSREVLIQEIQELKDKIK
jgi:hypothetical protein